MNFGTISLLLAVLYAPLGVFGVDLEALRLCGDIHRVNVNTAQNTDAAFVQSRCGVRCQFNGTWLSPDAINEGFPCPADATGTCSSGQCVSNEPESTPLAECTKRHDLNFAAIKNVGTGYINDHCALECVIDYQRVSLNVRNQGKLCRGDAGICKDGVCELHETLHPQAYYEDYSNLKSLNVKITDITINQATFGENVSAWVCLGTVEGTCKNVCLATITPPGRVMHDCPSMAITDHTTQYYLFIGLVTVNQERQTYTRKVTKAYSFSTLLHGTIGSKSQPNKSFNSGNHLYSDDTVVHGMMGLEISFTYK